MTQPNLARIKENVRRLVSQNVAPEEIDAYVQSEGATVEQVRDFGRNPVQLQGPVPPPRALQAHDQHMRSVAPIMQGLTFGFGDEIVSGLRGTGAAMQGQDFGRAFNQSQDSQQRALDTFRGEQPILSTGMEIASAIPTAIATTPAAVMGAGLSLGNRALIGGLTGAAQGGAYGFGAGQGSPEQRLPSAVTGGVIGGGIGAVAPVLGNAVATASRNRAQNAAVNAAIENTPSSSILRAQGGQMFNQLRQIPLNVQSQKMRDFAIRIGGRLTEMGFDAQLNPGAAAALRRIAMSANGTPSVADLHILRRIAANAAMSEGSDKAMGSAMVDMIDDFVANLGPTDFVPTNLIGQTKNPQQLYADAIATYRRGAAMNTVDAAISRAENAASGFENGLRVEFRRILNSPTLSRGLSDVQREAMERVVRGTFGSNFLRFMGTFGFPVDQGRNWLGAIGGLAAGSAAGIPGMLAAAGIGTASRYGARRLAESAADRTMRIAGTPNIPRLPPPNPRIPSRTEMLIRSLAPSGNTLLN